MRILMTLAAVTLLAAQGTALAQSNPDRPGWRDSEFQITPRAGVGTLRPDTFRGLDVNFDDEDDDLDTHGIGVGFGFLTPVGVVLELGLDVFAEDDLFDTSDSLSLQQQSISVGYQFELGNGWRIVPRVGRAHWKLRRDDGIFDFDDDDDDEREITGNDYFWEAGVSRRISRVVTLGLNYKQGNFDFGRTRSAAFVVTLGF